ncbi:hypothetical protein P170DRAFT_459476 [Aspergillus steynii IBT 23096]|uniref:Integral membrane protein n=1 Tax=Aspergillus steynii IBT 23096 TaxID=1392250 RepID=A0A2I2FTH8_9EURO|nr:uncharacterized protein P170DRAFT_459476 [Aspergillus steynii IBT 23096]PLB43926.1 hypothetical protein P170DRAFT_459476 [Aspergillus steynii IBT 23096]
MSLPILLFSIIYLYLTGSIFFDIAHYLLHQWSTSQWKLLRALSHCHQYHHLYYNRSLNFNARYRLQNAWIALPLEMACQILGSILGRVLIQGFLADNTLDNKPLYLITIIQIIRTLVVIAMSGHDSNHIAYDTVPKDPHAVLVGPQFHALHHVHPDRYMSSMVKLFDWIAGTAYFLRNKRVVITGGSGAFGQAIEARLHGEGVHSVQKLRYGRDWTHGDFSRTTPMLEQADILVLAHGSKGADAMVANCTSSMHIARRFIDLKTKAAGERKTLTLPEIWYVGSEIEVHPAWGIPSLQRYSASKRAFVPFARALYDDPRVVYRHIVPAAFESKMGRAIVSPEWAAGVAMWWIRRGAMYVPVTYTGLAFLNFFKFLYCVRPSWDGGDEKERLGDAFEERS